MALILIKSLHDVHWQQSKCHHMLALADEISDQQPQNPLELIDTHAKQVQLFNQVADNFIAERERRFKRKQ